MNDCKTSMNYIITNEFQQTYKKKKSQSIAHTLSLVATHSPMKQMPKSVQSNRTTPNKQHSITAKLDQKKEGAIYNNGFAK
jgi:hypothetical protein